MRILKALSLVVLLTALAGAMAFGSGRAADTGAATDTAPVLTWIVQDIGSWDIGNPEAFIYQESGKRVGVQVRPVPVERDVYRERLNTMIASGDLADIVTWDVDPVNQYGPEGLFVPYDEKWDSLPSYRETLQDIGYAEKMIPAHDGHWYYFPRIEGLIKFSSLNVRYDLLRRHGIDASRDIRTLEDLYDALQILKSELGGKAPLLHRQPFPDSGANAAMQMFGTGRSIYYNQSGATPHWEFGPLNGNYRDFVTFYQKLYAEGILHEDWLSFNAAESLGLLQSGEVAAIWESEWNSITWSRAGREVTGNEEFILMGVPNPAVDGVQYKNVNGNALTTSVGNAVWSKSEHVDEALRYIDFKYSEDGSMLMQFGQEGVHWRRTPEGVFEYLVYGNRNPGPDGDVDQFRDLGLYYTRLQSFRHGYPAGQHNPWQDEFYESRWAKWQGNLLDPQPTLAFTGEERETLTNLLTPLETYVVESTVGFILGRKPMSEWEAFTVRIEEMGAAQVVEIYETVQQRYDAR